MDSLQLGLSSLSLSGRCPATSSPSYVLDLSVAPPPGDAVAVARSDFTVRVHDLRTLRPTLTLSGHTKPLSAVAFARGSAHSLCSASLDGTVRLWDVRSRGDKAAQTFRSDASHSFSGFDLSCDDALLCAGTEQLNGEDSFLVFWDGRKPGDALLGVYSESHSDDITQVRFHPTDKDRLASGSTDGLVNVFDLSRGAEDEALQATCNSESSVSALCWLGQERLLSLSHDEGLQLWDLTSLDSEDELKVYSTTDARRAAREASPGAAVDYLIGGCCLDSEAKVLDSEAKVLDSEAKVLDSEAKALVLGGSGAGDVHLFSCDGAGLRLLQTLRAGHSATVRCFQFHPSSLSLFTGAEDGLLLRWSRDQTRPGPGSEAESGSSRGAPDEEEEELQSKRTMKSESGMKMKNRPHRKQQLHRDRKHKT